MPTLIKHPPLRQYVVALAAALAASAALAESDTAAGKYIVFAAGYGTAAEQDMNNYVMIGSYQFQKKGLIATYTEFDGQADSKPKKAGAFRHDLQAAYGKKSCEDKVFDIPSESAQRVVKASWRSADEKTLEITLGPLTYEWAADEAEGEGAYKLSRVTDNLLHRDLPLVVGYAYTSRDGRNVGKLQKKNFLPYYNGEIFHKDNHAYARTDWKPEPTGLKISAFTERDNGDILSYSSAGSPESKGAWVGNSILLNFDKTSPLKIYQDLGHDFNKNGCYDEYGHNKIIMAADDSSDGIIKHMVYIEYSYTFKGFPMLSVGRYHK